MSNTRKIISLVLAVVMAFSVFAICASATGETATWTVEVTKANGDAITAPVPVGDHVKVTVKLQTNFYVGVVGLPVYFSDAFSVVANSAQLTQIYGTGATRTQTNYAYSAPSGYSAFYALFVPNAGAGATAPMYSTATTILTFELEAISEATAEIKLDATKQKTSSNAGGVFYVGYHETASVSSDEGIVDTFSVPAATEVVIANAAADPVLTGVNGGYVDDANGYVYGIPVGADPADYFTVANGTFTVSGNGTGATLTVKTTGGADFATYTVVIFGDVDGDAAITSDDYVAVKNVSFGIDLVGAFSFAADVDGDGSITSDDYVAVKNVSFGIDLPVNPYA